MDALTLRDFKNVKDWSESDNIYERIQAANSKLASKQVLIKLANDEYWLIRLIVTMNKNMTEEILLEMKEKETEQVVLNQIDSELSYIENTKIIRQWNIDK